VRRYLLLVAVVALAAAACSDITPSAGGGSGKAAGGELRIGVAQPLSGPVADAGQSVLKGARIAEEELNAAGGVNGRKVKLVVEDDANDPATCVNAAQKLINQESVPVIMGGWGSSCTLAIEPVSSRSEVPLLVETSSSDKITDPKQSGNEWTFRISPTSAMEAFALKPALQRLGIHKAFTLSVNNDFGLGAASHYSEVLQSIGAKVVGGAKFDQSAQSFSSQVTQAIASGADTWIVTTDAGQIALLLKEAKGQGARARIVTTGGSNSPLQVMKLAGGDVADGSYATVFFPFFDPSLAAAPNEAQRFIETWKAKGYDFGQITEGIRGWQGIMVIAAAMRAAKDPTSHEELRGELAKVQVLGAIYGQIRFESWHNLSNQVVPPVYLTQVTNGQVKLVATGNPPY
jgi:branched-chain amino acid transport system substrate-binding protein